MDRDTGTFLIVGGAVAAVLYFLKGKIEKGADDLSKPIADAILAVTLPGDVTVLGRVKLPNGVQLGMSQLNIGPGLTFTYLGMPYKIVRREGAFYIAVNA